MFTVVTQVMQRGGKKIRYINARHIVEVIDVPAGQGDSDVQLVMSTGEKFYITGLANQFLNELSLLK